MKNSSKFQFQLQFQFLAFGLLVLSMVFSVPSFAKGGRASGGGSGCRANFLADVKEVSLWFKANGAGLTPPLSEDQFASAVSLDDLIELPESMDLNYNGGPVTALYDGESDKIKIRCDRYNKENPIGRKSRSKYC
jgi:hypothetical protein